MKLSGSPSSFFLRAACALAAIPFLAPRAGATWSIVVCDTKTREVCVASATCIEDFDLKKGLGLIQVGVGAAAAQSSIDSTGVNRRIIWDMMLQGFTPSQILTRLQTHGTQFQSRQYGIVTLADPAVTFTGSLAQEAKYGVAVYDMDGLNYAIQGNVLTGLLPVYAAEQALISTSGDLSQRVIAAMEAARAAGGDGRCSCLTGAPNSCGAPPPSFVYSSYTAFMVLARIGDTDGECNATIGCANGNYYLDLMSISHLGNPEPVLAMEQRYLQWRTKLVDTADQLKSLVAPQVSTLPADGTSQTTVDVQLVDLDGNLVDRPATLLIEATSASASASSVGTLEVLGGGLFRFTVQAGQVAGTATWKLTARHRDRDVRLWPDLAIELQ
jgi:hypothetical protein